MNLHTYHRRVWAVTQDDVKVLEPKKVGKKFKTYVIPMGSVAVVYSEGNDDFQIYVTYEALENKDSIMKSIIGLAIKLEIKEIKLAEVERIRDLQIWDQYVIKMNKMLAISF